MKQIILAVIALHSFSFLFAQTETYGSKQTKNWLSPYCDAEIVSFSSEYSSSFAALYLLMRTSVETDIPSGSVWFTEEGAKFPHTAVLKLCRSGGKISRFLISNYYEDDKEGGSYAGVSAKDIMLEYSNEGPDKGFIKIGDFKLKRSTHKQELKITPVTAKWIRVTIKSNYGNADYTLLGGMQAYTD